MIVKGLEWIFDDVVAMGYAAFKQYESEYFARPSCKSLRGEAYLNCMYEKINASYETAKETVKERYKQKWQAC